MQSSSSASPSTASHLQAAMPKLYRVFAFGDDFAELHAYSAAPPACARRSGHMTARPWHTPSAQPIAKGYNKPIANRMSKPTRSHHVHPPAPFSPSSRFTHSKAPMANAMGAPASPGPLLPAGPLTSPPARGSDSVPPRPLTFPVRQRYHLRLMNASPTRQTATPTSLFHVSASL